jgi:hypothetical protein
MILSETVLVPMMNVRLASLVIFLAASAVRADIPPTPDAGPRTGSAAGLSFAIQPVDIGVPPDHPRYTKTFDELILVGCRTNTANCRLAHAKHLLGLAIGAVDGAETRPEAGMVRQVLAAFSRTSGSRTVTLEFFDPQSNGGPWISARFGKP